MPGKNDKYVGGINKTDQARRAMVDFLSFYQSLFKFHNLAPIQTWFGVDEKLAYKIKRGEREAPRPDEVYKVAVNYGGRGSGKTYIVAGLMVNHCVQWERANTLAIRKHWNELHQSIIDDGLKRVLLEITDGRPDYISDGPYRKEGWYEYNFFTKGNPSRLTIKPEPDKAHEREVEDALKGPQYSLVWMDEMSQLQPVTFNTLRDNLRSPYVPFPRLIGTTNPLTRNMWLHKIVGECEKDQINGKRPKYLVIRSGSAENNPYLPKGYAQSIYEAYKDDPVKLAMLYYGEHGIEVEGTPIMQGKFHHNRNVGDLDFSPYSPILVGMDFGWTWNVAVFGQVVDRGFINILGELGEEGTTTKEFGQDILDFIKQKWPHARIKEARFYGDPNTAVQTNLHTGVTTAVELRRQCGINLEWCRREKIHGINTIKDLLTDHRVDGRRPRLMFDKEGAPDLIMAMLAGWRWKESGGVARPEPMKDGYYDHRGDALQYLVDNVVGPYQEVLKDKGYKDTPYIAEGMNRKRRPL